MIYQYLVNGEVLSAEHNGKNGWYIELENANVPGGYSYYKQIYDGGDVVGVSKKMVIN